LDGDPTLLQFAINDSYQGIASAMPLTERDARAASAAGAVGVQQRLKPVSGCMSARHA
jgi:hypothetical protein